MKGCSLSKPLLLSVLQQRRHSHCSTSLHMGLKLSQPSEWNHKNMWLPPAAHPPHVTACADVSGEETTTPFKLLTRPSLLHALAQVSLFLPGILSCQIKKPDAMSGSILLPASPHTQDSKTRTTRWILQFYIYNWTFIIFKISTRFITINYTLLSKYIKR